MKLSHTFLAVVGSLVLAAPARAAVTVDFTEMFDKESGPETIFKPIVTGTDPLIDTGGAVGTVVLLDFFGSDASGFNATYSLLEPGTKDDISDQITFSAVLGNHGSSSLQIIFTSEPAKFITGKTVYGSAAEIADQPSIELPDKLKGKGLTVSAQSDLDVPEPATWMLMLLGFGVTGLALRRGVDAGYLQHLV